jgi:beta-lactamase regulating signal transducer with metallopeptidase domain
MTLWIAWSALITALLALAAFGLERAFAHLGAPRRIVWIAAMTLAIVAPVLIALRVAPVSEAPRVAVASAVAAPAVEHAIQASTHVGVVEPSATERVAIARASIAATVERWSAVAWVIASTIWLSLLTRAVFRLRRRRRTWSTHDIDGERVLVSNDDGPAVIGFIHPRIVIPRWTLSADADTRALLLRHEREHVRANDSRVLFGAAVALAAFPWNAALWWMSRRLRLAIEIDCDARVIRSSGAPHSYGVMLVTVGERFATQPLPASAFLSEPGSHLEARIDAMTTPRAPRPIAAALPFVFAAAVVVGTAAWTPLPAPFRIRQQPAAKPAPPVVVQYTKPSAPPVVVHPNFVPVKVAAPAVVPPTLIAPSVKLPEVAAPKIEAPVFVKRAEPKPLRGNPGPRYPDVLRDKGTEGHVFVKFQTNAQNRPDTSTLTVIESTDPEFLASVRRTLPSWTYDSQGIVHFAVFFRGTGSTNPAPGSLDVDGVRVNPVIVVAVVNPRGDSESQQTPARRQFDAWLAAFNNPNAAVADSFHRRFVPDDGKVVRTMSDYRIDTGGFDLISVRRVQSTNLEFVARERGGMQREHVGYFAIASAADPHITSFRMLLVKPGQSVDDPPLIAHLQAMRP